MKPGEEHAAGRFRAVLGSTPPHAARFAAGWSESLLKWTAAAVLGPSLTRAALMEVRKAARLSAKAMPRARAALHAAPAAVSMALEQIHLELIAAQNAGDYVCAIGLNTHATLKLCEISNLPITHEVAGRTRGGCAVRRAVASLYDAGLPADLEFASACAWSTPPFAPTTLTPPTRR